jgi:DnaJ-class molecular chaperone
MTVEAECRACNGEGHTLKRRVLIGTGPVQMIAMPCDDCDGRGWIVCDNGGVDCPFSAHCYCEAAFDRQQADHASEPPMTADERHQQAWRERDALRGGY